MGQAVFEEGGGGDAGGEVGGVEGDGVGWVEVTGRGLLVGTIWRAGRMDVRFVEEVGEECW